MVEVPQSMVGEETLRFIASLRWWARDHLQQVIIAVASAKGGVGKTTIAVELAYCLDAVLVDLDWDHGCASRSLGWWHEQRVRSPLLDALDSGRTPRPIRGAADSRPDLVPAGPDLEANLPSVERMSNALIQWATDWGRPVVVDTHPGGNPPGDGAMAAAHLTLTPTKLGQKELEALDGFTAAHEGYNLLITPNEFVNQAWTDSHVDRIAAIAQRYQVPVSAPIPEDKWLRSRKARTAVCAARTMPKRHDQLITSYARVAHQAAHSALTALEQNG